MQSHQTKKKTYNETHPNDDHAYPQGYHETKLNYVVIPDLFTIRKTPQVTLRRTYDHYDNNAKDDQCENKDEKAEHF